MRRASHSIVCNLDLPAIPICGLVYSVEELHSSPFGRFRISPEWDVPENKENRNLYMQMYDYQDIASGSHNMLHSHLAIGESNDNYTSPSPLCARRMSTFQVLEVLCRSSHNYQYL